jgi:hypothetical protein
MMMVASGAAPGEHQVLKTEIVVMEQGEGVSGMMAMNILQQASDAEVIVIAVHTSDHISLVKLYSSLNLLAVQPKLGEGWGESLPR